MNLPNKLSCLRILLVPFIIAFAYLAKRLAMDSRSILAVVSMLVSFLLFVLASFTDYLDGHIARKYQIVSNFGKFIDPIADKLLVLATMILFVELGFISAWIPIITLFRDLIVTGIRLIALESSGKVIAANFWGKIKTVAQIISLIVCFVYGIYAFAVASVGDLLTIQYGLGIETLKLSAAYANLHHFYLAMNGLAWITVLIALFSGLTYWLSNRKLLATA